MKRALLPINTQTYFSDLFRLAKELRDSKRLAPVIVFVADYPTRPSDIQACRLEGIEHRIEPPEESAPHEPARGRRHRLFGYALRKLHAETEWREYRQHVRHQQRRIAAATSLLEQEHADLLVLAGNLIHYDAPAFVEAAHRRRIPAIVTPSWMAGPLEAAEAFHHLPPYSAERGWNRLFAALYPRWSFTHRGRKLVRLPAPQALAMERLRLAPPRPWVLHSGFADAVAVESEAMRDYCLQEGLPADRLRVTGSAAHDVMARIAAARADARTALCRSLGFDENRPLLLSAIPPDQLYTGGRTECEFQDFRKLLGVWVQSLSGLAGWNVVLNLHPSLKPDEWTELERHGARISRQKIETLIPLCDLYVASISSTIQWAIACGKPVVNYDVYLYRYTDYAGVDGVLPCETSREFRSLLERMTSDAAFAEEIRQRQARNAPRWGVLDGRAVERLTGVFEDEARRIRSGA